MTVFLLISSFTSLLCTSGNQFISGIGAKRIHKDMQERQLQCKYDKQGFATCCGYFTWFISSEAEQKPPQKTGTLFIVTVWEGYVNSIDYKHQNPCSVVKLPTHLPVQIELLHLLFTVAYPNEGTWLSLLLCATLLLHIL